MSIRDLARPVLRRLPGPARAALRFAAHPRRESRYLADWLEFRRDLRPIIEALRAAVPAATRDVLIHSTHGFVPSLKEDVLHALMLVASGVQPVFLTSRSGGLDRYHRLVPGARLVYWDDYAALPTADDARIGRELVARAGTGGELVRAEWHGVAVGRHAVSRFMRTRHLGTIDLAEHAEALTAEMAQAVAATRAAQSVLDRETAATVLMSERGYTPYGEFFDIALAQGRRVVQWCGAHRDDARIFKAYSTSTRAQHPCSLSADTWALALATPFDDARRDAVLARWKEFYVSRTWYNFQRLQHRTEMMSRERVIADLGLDPAKPTAALFAHIFWDATFFYGDGLFEDYEQWFVETVRLANRSTDVNWVVKLHPVNVWRLEADGVAGSPYAEITALERAGIRLSPHVKLILPDTEISTWSIFQAADYCFTVRGTAGIEMAALGKRVVTAGSGYYSAHGFTVDPPSRDAYEQIVLHPTALEPMSDAERDRAIRFAYWLLERKAYRFDTHRFEYSAAKDVFHPLNGRARVLVPNGQEFLRSGAAAAWASWLTSSTAEDCLAPMEDPGMSATTEAALAVTR